MRRTNWIVTRIVIPLIVAASTPFYVDAVRGNPNGLEMLPFFLPCLVVILHIGLGAQARPKALPVRNRERFDQSLAAWHGLDVISCVLLMVFEMTMAVMLTNGHLIEACLWGSAIFLPYLLLSVAARRRLIVAYEILATEVVEGRELVEKEKRW